MRYGIFADIHSNLEAYQSIIDAYKAEDIDKYICLGDIVGYAANPSECIDLTRKLNPLIIAGNHDWAVAGKLELEWFNEKAAAAITWTKDVLTSKDIEYLSELRLIYEESNFNLVHATLNEPWEFHYLTNIQTAWDTFLLLKNQIIFVGHTHVPGIFLLSDDNPSYIKTEQFKLDLKNKYIINVGSVGQPRDKDSRACFCIFDTQENLVQIRRIDYNIGLTQRKILNTSLPESFAMRLSIGS